MHFMARLFNLQHPSFESWVCEAVYLVLRGSRRIFVCGLLHEHGPRIAYHLLSARIGSSRTAILQICIRSLPILEILVGPLMGGTSGGAIASVVAPEYTPCINFGLEWSMRGAISVSAFLLGKYADRPLREIHPWLPTVALSLYAGYNILRPFIPGKTISDLVIDMVYRRAVLPSRRSLREHRVHRASSFLRGRSLIPTFQYSSLTSGCVIRLIQLEVNLDNDGVVCDIVEADLSTSPHYDAVSYCWGSSEKPHSLVVKEAGCEFYIPITESARQALRDCAPLHGTRYLWIDSICINQDDEVEKSHQITLMSQIYSKANQVIIHLGDDETADTAVSFVNRLYFHYNLKDNQAFSRVIRPDEFDVARLFRKQNPVFMDDAHMWEAWEKLATNRYWERVWIIQECAVAQRLVAVYGGALVAWDLLPFSAAMFSGTSTELALRSRIPAVRNLAMSGAQSAIISLMHLRLIYAGRDAAQNIWELAVIARNSKSTEPQDKVFGLLGMSQQADVPYLQPDGRKTLCEIYGSVVRAGLENGSFLTFCISGLSLRRNDSLPSWIPDLANPPFTDTMRYHERREYKALVDSTPSFEFSSDWQQLKIQGVCVGTIAVKTPDPVEAPLPEVLGLPALDMTQLGIRIYEQLVDVRDIFDSNISHEEMAGLERIRTFWHTITDDFDGRSPWPQAEQEQLLHSLEKSLFQIAQNLEDLRQEMGGDPIDQVSVQQLESAISSRTPMQVDVQNARSAEVATEVFDRMAENDEVRDFLAAEIIMAMYALSTSTLVITEDKKVALAPVGTQLNDVIVILDGSPLPHILRPKEGCRGLYELVGEAYMYGIAGFQATDPPRSYFVLC